MTSLCEHVHIPLENKQEWNGWPQDQVIGFLSSHQTIYQVIFHLTFTSLSMNFPVTPSAHHSDDVQ